MHIFNKIELKLRLAFISMVAITAIGGAVSYLKVQEAGNYVGYKEKVMDILLHLKEARLHEKNFIMYDRKTVNFLESAQSQTTEAHQAEIATINSLIDSLIYQNLVEDVVLNTMLSDMKSGIKMYNDSFDELTKLYQQRGFKDHGLEGSMREDVHNLQEAIGPREKIYAYSLRRHEKDFMLRKDLKYFETLRKTAEEFKEYVRMSDEAHMSPAYKKNISRVIDNYIQKFVKIVELEMEIGLSESEGVSGKLLQSANDLEPISDAMLIYADTKSADFQQQASFYFLGSVILMILAGFFIVIGLDKSISRPIALLNDVIKDEINGKERTNALEGLQSRDEIGELSTNFKLMMKKLDQQFDAINETNKVLEEASEIDKKKNGWRKAFLPLWI
ncbi:MAG: methyl-accepting chemotaxis protein [Cyclobacteriaceae bacterium]|nr:methyl-accepting chemotaxis protein [Cyclobacteriaceae bacterium]